MHKDKCPDILWFTGSIPARTAEQETAAEGRNLPLMKMKLQIKCIHESDERE